MSGFVAKKYQRRTGIAHLPGTNVRAGGAAQYAVLLIALSQNVFTAGSPDHFVTAVPGNSLCSLVPEQNFPVAAYHINAGVQAFQDRPEDVGILKFRHCRNQCFLSKVPSALHGETAGARQQAPWRISSLMAKQNQGEIVPAEHQFTEASLWKPVFDQGRGKRDQLSFYAFTPEK
jgi:hypothetical protein